MKKYVLITGASSGLGKETAKVLAEDGFGVFAGFRKEEDKIELEKLNSNITGVYIDVTDKESVEKAYLEISEKTDVLYALVNNAGIALAGPVECLDIDVIKKQFDVNVYGPLRVAQKFLPMLGKGRIVNISSMASFAIFPFISPYSASKRALDIFFNSLLLENKNADLKIISIKPGVVKTNIWDKSLEACEKIFAQIPHYYHEKYKSEYEFLTQNAKKNNNSGLEPHEVAKLVLKVLTVKNPGLSYCIGKDSKFASVISCLPQRILNFLIKKGLELRIGR